MHTTDSPTSTATVLHTEEDGLIETLLDMLGSLEGDATHPSGSSTIVLPLEKLLASLPLHNIFQQEEEEAEVDYKEDKEEKESMLLVFPTTNIPEHRKKTDHDGNWKKHWTSSWASQHTNPIQQRKKNKNRRNSNTLLPTIEE